MDAQSYSIQWIQHHTPGDMKTAGQLLIDSQNEQDDEVIGNGVGCEGATEFMVDGDGDMTTAADIEQIAAENLIFMARDGQVVSEIIASGTDEHGVVVVSASDGTNIDCSVVMQQAGNGIRAHHFDHHNSVGIAYEEHFTETTPQMVTEEIITDDWVQHQGEERVEIPAEQIMGSSSQVVLDVEVPLPTVQDEYTALRPYPCDFCSRRFRKKASLMNHMVAHQNDRPHLCKLCGSRFFRRSDLINHLKAHAETPNPEFEDADFIHFEEQEQQQQRQINDHYYDQDWGMQNEEYIIPSSIKTSRSKTQTVGGNSSSTSTSTVLGRGRISRLKPKEESYSSINDYAECQQLQADTAAVKLTQDQSSMEQKHFSIINDNKPFVCQFCGLAFAREKALLSHSKTHRNDSPHECLQCSEIFWDKSCLYEHQKTHHFEESNSEFDPAEVEETQSDESEAENLYGEFYCSECGMSFHRQDLLHRHSKLHDKQQNTSGSADEFLDNSRDLHCCNTCGETFAEALDLLAHAEIHARHPAFKCLLCGESFFEENTIKRHVQSQHANEMTPNSCILCGKECRDRKALIKHAWDHSREKCHSCSKCGKNFHNKARLKRHMSSHRDKSVPCDVCHEEFPDGRSLSNHRHSHSTTSAGKMFPCHECGKTFGSRSSQQIHVRIHTGERPYGCRFCWKAFADGGTLRKHERIHTGEKPYACSVCPRAFNQRVVLREHIRSHHSGLDMKHKTFYCTVCSAVLPSSNDLVQHLISHSDMNTAMKRQPITGPRKYKRRRKLKPHELARLRGDQQLNDNDTNNGNMNGNSNGSDVDISDFDMENVDDILGVAEATQSTQATKVNGKRQHITSQRSRRTVAAKLGKSTAGGAASATQNGEQNVNAEQDNEPPLDVVTVQSGQRPYSSLTSNEESYKSLLSNLENTLQSIDTLVVDSHVMSDGVKGMPKVKCEAESTAQRTQQFKIVKVEGKRAPERRRQPAAVTAKATRKKPEKLAKGPRPRMIHTENWRASGQGGGAKKRRGKSFITRTDAAQLDQLLPSSSSTIVDDYEIISPDVQPPKQISSSPLHIKQEHEQDQQRPQHNMSSSPPDSQNSHNLHGSDLYDAQLLLETSALRKDTLEKFNPSLVNVLEDILRSPIKGNKGERERFTSESSTQFLVEQSEGEEQHLIKIEPTSPDLHEIVNDTVISCSSGSVNNSQRRSVRSTRSSRMVTVNRKYLEFETVSSTLSRACAVNTPAKRAAAGRAKATNKQRKELLATAADVTKSTSVYHYSYGCEDYDTTATASASTAAHVSTSSYPSMSATDVDSTAAAAATATTSATAAPTERKQRYFECEMCSAIFLDRAQLLDHVPIHI